MKRILACLLALTLLLPLASCGQKGKDAETDGAGSFDEIARKVEETWYPYDLSEYVEVMDWDGVAADYADPDVCTEEEIDDAVFQVMLTYATYDQKEGAAALYDLVLCDSYVYFGTELLDDLTQMDHEIVLGQKPMDDVDYVISQEMTGCGPGDVCCATYTYPDVSYTYGDLAGKTVQLAAEIKAVYAPTIPDCDEDFVRSLPDAGFDTVDDFRAALKQDILDEKKEDRNYAVWKAYFSRARILQYPEEEITKYEDDYLDYYREFADDYGMELDAYLREYFGAGLETFEAQAREYAESAVKYDLIYTALARQMKTTLTREEYNDWINVFYKRVSGQFESLEEFIEYYGEEVLYVNAVWEKSLRTMSDHAVRLTGEEAETAGN